MTEYDPDDFWLGLLAGFAAMLLLTALAATLLVVVTVVV